MSAGAAGAAREQLRQLFERYAGGPLPDWHAVAPMIRPFPVRQGQVVVDENADRAVIFLVTAGVYHVRVVARDGSMTTVNFAGRGEFLANLPSIEDPRQPLMPSDISGLEMHRGYTEAANQRYYIKALTPGALVEVPIGEMQRRATYTLAWARAMSTAYLVYAQAMRYERDRMRLPAEARYRSFLIDYAPVLRYVQQKDIADFLGISEVGLSRIATRVRREAAQTAPSEHPHKEHPHK